MTSSSVPYRERDFAALIYRFGFWFLIVVGLVATVGSVISMMYAGIGWDARMDTGQSVVIREVVPNLPPGSSLGDAYDKIFLTAEFYGILLPQLGDLLYGILSGSIFSGSIEILQLNDMAAYRLQGLASIVIAAIAAGSLGFAITSALASRLAGAFAWALIMCTPLYFGMSSLNIKDMPLAAGFTLITSGFILNRSAKSAWVHCGVAILFTSSGASVALATRPGLWPLLLAFAGMVLFVFGLSDFRNKTPRRSIPGMVSLAISVPVALIFLWWTNPLGRFSLFPWLWDAFDVMRDYPWDGSIRVAGLDVLSTNLPWWYVPAWVLAQLPVLTTVAILAAVVASLASVFRARWALARNRLFLLAPVFIQAVVLPCAVIVSGATLYDGIRHLLFAIPALLGLSAIAVATLENARTFEWISPKSLATIVAIFVVGLSAWATARWVPYSYAYINPIAGWNHPQRDWELDYWGLTAAEGVERLKQAGFDTIGVLPIEETAGLFGGASLSAVLESGPDAPYGLYVFNRWDVGIGDCDRAFSIVRDGQILGEGAVCQPAAVD